MKKIIIFCLAAVVLISSFFNLGVSALGKENMSDKIFAVSRGGDTSEFPQNSTEAIDALEGLGFDAVSATVRKTADSHFILFENETTEGVCVDADGNATNAKVAETDFNTLQSYFLLSNTSVNLSKKTDCKIAELHEILDLIDGKMLMIIDCEEALIEEAYEYIKSIDSLNDVIFRCRKMKTRTLTEWAVKKTDVPKIITYYKGNVITSAINSYSLSEKASAFGNEFSTKNRYGVIFSEFFTKRFSKTYALMSVYNSEYAGYRPDSVLGWENLIKLGYSAIETSNAKEFSKYVSLLDETELNLKNVLADAKSIDTSTFSLQSGNNLKKHIGKAEKLLLQDTASSQDEMNTCIENIKTASDGLIKGSGDSQKVISVTPMKIFWIVFAVALFTASQIYLRRKTSK